MFALLNAYAALCYIQSHLTKSEFRYFFIISIVGAAGIVFLTVVGLTWAGKVFMVSIFLLVSSILIAVLSFLATL